MNTMHDVGHDIKTQPFIIPLVYYKKKHFIVVIKT